MVCLLGREGKCETAVWDVCGDTRECVFSSALFFLYIVHVQSSTCLWYKCGIFPHADQIGTCISITSPATETVSN